MPDPSTLRDSTQIVVPCSALDGVRESIADRFMITIVENAGQCRLIGSPVEIKDLSEFLARNGITVP